MRPICEATIRRTAPDEILSLNPNEVFVFGTNAQGFHGAGAAGIAFRGTPLNDWRNDKAFLEALEAPTGSEKRIGRWAVLGISKGLMRGRSGLSYGIQTVTAPGKRRSVPQIEIGAQFFDLWTFADQNPGLTFLVSKVGCGLAGYQPSEIQRILKRLDLKAFTNAQVLLPREFEWRN